MLSLRRFAAPSLAVALLVASATASGQAPDEADLSQLAEQSVEQFEPLGDEHLREMRRQLGERLMAVERLVGPGSAWLDYLRWDGATQLLDPEGRPDFAAAEQTLRQLSSGAEGLERPELGAAYRAIDRFLGLAPFAMAPADRQQQSYEAAASGLAEMLADPERLAAARGSFQAERRLDVLADLAPAGRGGPLLDAAQRRFGASNLIVEVQAPLLDRFVSRPVTDCAPLTDCILGTSIRGTGATSARLGASPIESAGRARLAFSLVGSTRSQTVGVNGPAQIRSVGNTTFYATKVVELSDESFRLLPATAEATTRTRTQSVSKVGGGLGSRLVSKIGSRRVAEQKPLADAIAGEHAEDRVAAGLDRRLTDEIVEARRRYDDRVTRPLRRRRATPRRLTQSTTREALFVDAVLADEGQLAAWGPPPPGVPAPLSVRLHQTAVNNFLDAYLAGVTIRRESVDEPPRLDIVAPPWLDLKAEAPAQGRRFQPWSIRLRDRRPVSVEFNQGELTALVHAEEIRVEDKVYEGWDLIVTYRPELVDGHWRLQRQGRIDVLPTDFDPDRGGRLASRDVGLRNNLSDAINDPPRLPDTIDIDPIDLTRRQGPIDWLSMVDFRVGEGWLSAGWRAL
ncbi:hypothetical protein [Botrimarina sp.]|uniref:hypothetical protein n=1 Tax=Botrimarina sp. TaxID=2795802 RepID=UPI0032EB0B6A